MLFTVEVKSIADKVRTARAARNWSQVQLATVSRTTQWDVSRIERGISIDEDDRKKILEALEIE